MNSNGIEAVWIVENTPAPVQLSDPERQEALARYRVVQPYLEGQASLTVIARRETVTLRTLQRWVAYLRTQGLAGLARKRRADRGQRRLPSDLVRLVEGLALQKSRPSAAAIHRAVAELAAENGWETPSYSCIYDIVRKLDPGLLLLAREGPKAYQNHFDLVYRREADRPNLIWQADHTLLNIWLVGDDGQPARPWLTVIEDDFSRCIAGYFLTFTHPNTLNTALTLRQAIWRKADPRWRICGIPEIFYSDHGSDFTSDHMGQVCIDLNVQLIFSMVGMPRGRGRIERFFRTVDQLFLHRLPGFAPDGGGPPAAATSAQLSLPDLDALFQEFLLGDYHRRSQRDRVAPPQERWEFDGFLPRLPESLEQLDLLLLTVAKSRRVHRDGIHFQNLRYLDPALADYVGERVIIRYDPRDMAEIRVLHADRFLCRAICQELADQKVSLKEIVHARKQRLQELRTVIKDRSELVQRYLNVHQVEPDPSPSPAQEADQPPPVQQTPRLKRYANE